MSVPTTTTRPDETARPANFTMTVDEFMASSGSEEASAGEEGDCVATTADPITNTEPGEEDNTKIKQPNEKENISGLQSSSRQS